MKTHLQTRIQNLPWQASFIRPPILVPTRLSRLSVVCVLSWLLFFPLAEGHQALQSVVPSNPVSNVSAGGTETHSTKSATDTPSQVTISGVTVVQGSDGVIVRVEGTGRLDSKPFTIPNPERLVLDFPATQLGTQKRLIPGDLPPIRDVRLAQHDSSVRVVVDLNGLVPFEVSHDGGAFLVSFLSKASDSHAGIKHGLEQVSQQRTPPSVQSAPTASPQTYQVTTPFGIVNSTQPPRQAAIKPAAPLQNPGPTAQQPVQPAMNSTQPPRQAAIKPAAPLQNPGPTAQQPVQPVLNSAQTPQQAATKPAVPPQNSGPAVQQPVQPANASVPQGTAQPSPSAAAPTAPSPASTEANPAQQPSAPQTNPGAGVQAPPVAPEDKQSVSVSLNLENVDLYQVIRIIGTELKINYMVDPAVKGSVTINTSGSISRADLFSILESILQVNGAAIIKQDGYYRIVPANDAKAQPVPLVYAKSQEVPPAPGETFVLEVFPMKYIAAGEMGKVLSPFVSPAGQLIVNEKGNVLLVLETPPKLKQIANLLDIFDSSTFSRQRVRLFQLRENSAKSMIKELQDVFSGYSFSGNSAIRFVAIDSLNAVLAISPDPEAFKEIEQWIRQLDQPPPRQAGEQNYVYPVQNAKASDLRDVLLQLYGGSFQKELPAPNTLPLNPANPMVSPEAIAEAQRAQQPQNPEVVQGRLHIMSDDKNNSLIIQASPHDYEIVKRTIIELDLLPRQVMIDAQIYSVDLTGDLSLGISYYLGQQSSLPGPLPLSSSGSFAAGQSPGSLVGTTFAILSQTRALQMFVNATDQRSRVKVLSAPSILVTDNTSARIQVGASVPVPIGSALTPVQSNGSSLFAQTIQYQDTGVILTVTPHINSSGVVTLNLTQEVSSAVPNSTSQIVAPVINKSTFQTNVVLADGEPLALGGMITTTNSVSTDRIPVLGEIPGLGALFGTTTRKTERDEIVLIITPHVLQHLPQAASQSQELVDRMREIKKDMDSMN